MSDLRENLKNEFQDADYRYAYAESFLNTKIATQIKTLREQRGKSQTELGTLMGTKQSGFSRFEDVNHSVWKTDTLWKIARALGVRVNLNFATFGSLIDEKEHFSREALQVPDFESDPAFQKNPTRAKVPRLRRTVKRGFQRRRKQRPLPAIARKPASQERYVKAPVAHGSIAYDQELANPLYPVTANNSASSFPIPMGSNQSLGLLGGHYGR